MKKRPGAKKLKPLTEKERTDLYATVVEDRLNSIERHAALLRQCAFARLHEEPDGMGIADPMVSRTDETMMEAAEAIYADSRAIRRAFDSQDTRAYFLKAPYAD